ncbi:MAG: hypothetical protein L6R28_25200 [Planctomycetes bacterium]|nr:hypothetical protein [Planctomycetota bacterium]
MKTTNRKNWMIGAGMMAALAIFLLPTTNAEAAHRHHHHNRNSVSLSFGGGGCGGYWVPGHYETTTETYLAEAGHYENQWVPAQYKLGYDHCGKQIQILVADGYWAKVWIPERYETRTVQYWVPGYYASYGGPRVGVGLNFRF